MILTEEQRAAIKLAMKYIARWPFAYKELHAGGVLQAMIDSSEHIREPPKMVGFDLERARGLRDFLQDDCAEVGDVWAEMIAEIERLRAMIDSSEHFTGASKMIGFDLEKARASDEALPYPLDAKEIWISGKGQMHINPPNGPSIFFTLSDLCEFRNLFHGRAAEIERLRKALDESERVVAHKTKSAAHWYDEHLQARADRVQTRRVVEQQTTRIKALADALVDERAKVIMLIEKLQLVANDPDWQSKGLKHDFDWYLAESKKEIESGEPEDQRCRRLEDPEGKIGPDAEAAHRECQECSEEFCDEDECPKPRKEDVPKHCYSCGKSMEDVNGDLCKGDYFIGAILLDPGQEESRYDPPIDASYYFACPGCAKVWLKERGQE